MDAYVLHRVPRAGQSVTPRRGSRRLPSARIAPTRPGNTGLCGCHIRRRSSSVGVPRPRRQLVSSPTAGRRPVSRRASRPPGQPAAYPSGCAGETHSPGYGMRRVVPRPGSAGALERPIRLASRTLRWSNEPAHRDGSVTLGSGSGVRGCDCSCRRLQIVAVGFSLGACGQPPSRPGRSLGSRGGCPRS